MKKAAKKNNRIKDSISKLFILRDSCQGTCMTQKDNPNIFWFEGATVLLQQGVDNLKEAMQKGDVGNPSQGKVKETVSKLTVLQRSAVVTRSEDVAENAVWFEGAEYMLSDVINQLQKELQKTGSQAAAEAESESSESEEPEEEEEEEEEE
jgi:hypothetical protein